MMVGLDVGVIAPHLIQGGYPADETLGVEAFENFVDCSQRDRGGDLANAGVDFFRTGMGIGRSEHRENCGALRGHFEARVPANSRKAVDPFL